MKLLLVSLLFGCWPALGQEKPPGPPEGADVIAVLLPDSGAVAFGRVVEVLFQRGYFIKTRDQPALRLTAEPRPLSEGPDAFSMQVQVIVMGHTALFSGVASYGNSRRLRPLSYSAYSHVHFANFDYVAAGWMRLEAIVEALPGKRKVVYFPRP